jgi:hypothetical protein
MGMLALTNCLLHAQIDKEEIDYIQKVFGMEKKAAIASFLKISEDDAFWALYDQYEIERKEFGKKRIDLLEKYANNYVDMPEVVIDDLIKQMQNQKNALDKLIDIYYKRIKKSSGSKLAAQFYQFEFFTLSAVRLEVLAGIPFIGELD